MLKTCTILLLLKYTALVVLDLFIELLQQFLFGRMTEQVDPTVWPVSSPTIAGGMILCQGFDDIGWD